MTIRIRGSGLGEMKYYIETRNLEIEEMIYFFSKLKEKKKDGRMKSVTQRRGIGDVLQAGSEILFKGEKKGKANLVGRFVTPKALRIMLLDVSTVISVIRASSILSTLIVGG